MDIMEPPLVRPQEIQRLKGTMLNVSMTCTSQNNLYVGESAKVKELLVEHNETTFHDHEKSLTRTNTMEHKIPITGRPIRIPPHRTAPWRGKIVVDEIQKMEKEGTITECKPLVFFFRSGEKKILHYSFLCGLS